MSSKEYILLIFGMFVVTYVPRVLPFFIIKKEKVPKQLNRFLSYISYAMLGALIMPGFINAIEGEPVISVISLLGGIIVCIKFGGAIVPILSAIIIAALLQLI